MGTSAAEVLEHVQLGSGGIPISRFANGSGQPLSDWASGTVALVVMLVMLKKISSNTSGGGQFMSLTLYSILRLCLEGTAFFNVLV